MATIESFDEKMNKWMERFAEIDPMNERPVSVSQRKKGYPPPPPMTAITKTHIEHETEYYDPRTLEKISSLPKHKYNIENGGIISYDQEQEINELNILNSSLKEKYIEIFNENKRILDTNKYLGRKLNKLQKKLDTQNITKKKEEKIKARVDKIDNVKSIFGNVGKRIVGWFYE